MELTRSEIDGILSANKRMWEMIFEEVAAAILESKIKALVANTLATMDAHDKMCHDGNPCEHDLATKEGDGSASSDSVQLLLLPYPERRSAVVRLRYHDCSLHSVLQAHAR